MTDLHLHDLRHTALTWAARSGATLAELMVIAGHATPEIALRYQHVCDEERRGEPAGQIAARELEVERIRSAMDRARELSGDASEALEAAVHAG